MSDSFFLRAGQDGELAQGDPGDVLTFQSDGRVAGEPSAAVAPVRSVFGRIGDIIAEIGDYDASQIFNDGTAPGATVKLALENLVAAIAALAASNISNDSSVVGATVKAALNTLLAAPLPVSTIGGPTYTLAANDAGTYLRFTNAGGCVVTLNNNVFSAGQWVLMRQVAAGAVTFTGSLAPTPPVTNAAASGQQGATFALVFPTATSADLSGDLQDL